MAPPWSTDLVGRLDTHVIDSVLLRDNPLGDPAQRPLWVYVPPGYDDDPVGRLPSIYVIQGYTGHLGMWHNRTPFRPTYPEALDALFADGRTPPCPPCLVVFVDAWTSYGGSQFVDSTGTGRYHSYLCDEVVPWVDAHYRTLASADWRAIAGKSSGGFGAMITPMLRPDLFGHLATHAGDALYEHCYLQDFAQAVRFLRAYDGDIWRWWADFAARAAFSRPEDEALITALGCSAAFSPGPDGRPVLPFDPRTGVVVEDVWARWLAWDPVRMVPQHAEALRGLSSIWIDAGTGDDYYLDLGAAAFRAALAEVGVEDERVHFELFDATHAAIDYRYPLAVSWLARRMAR